MAALKTRKNTASVADFINGIPDERKRQDSLAILDDARGHGRRAGDVGG